MLLTGCGSSSEEFQYDNYISVVSREDGSGTRGAFISLFGIEQKSNNGDKKDLTTKEAIIANKTDVVMANIGQNKYSIGYVSTGSLNENIKALHIDGAAPTSENIKNGSYKIARPFIIATNNEISEVAQDFMNFILSKEGQEVVNETYVSVDDNAQEFKGTKPSGKLVIAGSSSVSPVMEKLIEAYEVINPSADIELQISDSTSGMQGVIDGTCDIGMASRELTESEQEQLQSTAIALDGIAVIVNKDNPIDGMNSKDITEIFKGEVTSWEIFE